MSRDHTVNRLRPSMSRRAYDLLVRWSLRERTWRGELCRALDPRAGECVVDVGCGKGAFATFVKMECPRTVVCGIDLDPEALGVARRRCTPGNDGIAWVRGSAVQLPCASASVDRVVSSLMFHHLTPCGKERAAREVLRILRPGGVLHIADWGRPHGPLMRAAFLAIQLVDGLETTRDSVQGRLPAVLQRAGFVEVQETSRFRTLYGSLCLYRAERPGQPRCGLQ